MITCLVPDGKPFSQIDYDKMIDDIPFHQLCCSCGAHGTLIRHAYCTRHLKLVNHTCCLCVLRVKCKSCACHLAILLCPLLTAVIILSDPDSLHL